MHAQLLERLPGQRRLADAAQPAQRGDGADASFGAARSQPPLQPVERVAAANERVGRGEERVVLGRSGGQRASGPGLLQHLHALLDTRSLRFGLARHLLRAGRGFVRDGCRGLGLSRGLVSFRRRGMRRGSCLVRG